MTTKKAKKKYSKGVIKENLQIYALMMPTLILIFIFCYIPMYGIIIACQDYVPGRPFWGDGTKWVGIKHFLHFVEGRYFYRLIKNSVILSLMNLIFGFTMPIILALLLDQIRSPRFKKLAQTASYMPHFISMVVVAGIAKSFVETNGLFTQFLNLFGEPARGYADTSAGFPWFYTIINVWKSFGFGSILYCSTISSIDPGLYESAKIDGANRWKQVWYITLPGLRNLMAINLIMSLGGILGGNSELILLIYSPRNYEVSDIIGTYVFRMGIESAKYSYSTATGLFMSVIGFTLTYTANKISTKMTGWGLW